MGNTVLNIPKGDPVFNISMRGGPILNTLSEDPPLEYSVLDPRDNNGVIWGSNIECSNGLDVDPIVHILKVMRS